MNWGYLIPQEMSRRWLGEGSLALLLDGLNEVGPEHIGDCIAALNRFREDHGLLHIAICTRTEAYRAAAELLRLSGAVRLLPLTDDQIDAYLAAAGSRAATLAALLQQDADLLDLARTPLMLSLMPQAYADVSPEDLQGEHFNTPQKRREHLLNRYINYLAAQADAGPSTPFTREQTLSELGWLAHGMTAQPQSIFLVEKLQPGLVGDARQTLGILGRLPRIDGIADRIGPCRDNSCGRHASRPCRLRDHSAPGRRAHRDRGWGGRGDGTNACEVAVVGHAG